MDKSLESGSIGWMIHSGMRTMEDTIQIPNRLCHIWKQKQEGERAGIDNNEEWIQRIWVHLHLHVAKDNRTWRRNVAIINNWQKSLTGNMIDIKNNMSHMKYHGFSMVLRGDEITIVRTSTLQVWERLLEVGANNLNMNLSTMIGWRRLLLRTTALRKSSNSNWIIWQDWRSWLLERNHSQEENVPIRRTILTWITSSRIIHHWHSLILVNVVLQSLVENGSWVD